jgi:hypothetical protein
MLPLLLILTAGAARAADAPKPNALTPQEIAEGWILLFDGESTFGWTVAGDAKMENGKLILGGKKATKATTTTAFKLFELILNYEVEGSGAKPQILWGEGVPGIRNTLTGSRTISIVGGDPIAINPFMFEVPAGLTVKVRGLKLKPMHLTPIFNGKDLSGWKQYAGDANRSKSKFSVTPEGWLNVTNGPGDLQTEKEWQDFVFQGECISNGKHLNSGIFFRCLPGQYQNGYEMQIRNQWEGDDRTKPVDFGTGAIYRRQPARKVVSTDGEWFTMTLVAHGNHFATWVDGYQVTDWTDTRPENANARNGCKLGAGPLSIQGHDPTTNLSFRNLRVAELPRKKD